MDKKYESAGDHHDIQKTNDSGCPDHCECLKSCKVWYGSQKNPGSSRNSQLVSYGAIVPLNKCSPEEIAAGIGPEISVKKIPLEPGNSNLRQNKNDNQSKVNSARQENSNAVLRCVINNLITLFYGWGGLSNAKIWELNKRIRLYIDKMKMKFELNNLLL